MNVMTDETWCGSRQTACTMLACRTVAGRSVLSAHSGMECWKVGTTCPFACFESFSNLGSVALRVLISFRMLLCQTPTGCVLCACLMNAQGAHSGAAIIALVFIVLFVAGVPATLALALFKKNQIIWCALGVPVPPPDPCPFLFALLCCADGSCLLWLCVVRSFQRLDLDFIQGTRAHPCCLPAEPTFLRPLRSALQTGAFLVGAGADAASAGHRRDCGMTYAIQGFAAGSWS